MNLEGRAASEEPRLVLDQLARLRRFDEKEEVTSTREEVFVQHLTAVFRDEQPEWHKTSKIQGYLADATFFEARRAGSSNTRVLMNFAITCSKRSPVPMAIFVLKTVSNPRRSQSGWTQTKK